MLFRVFFSSGQIIKEKLGKSLAITSIQHVHLKIRKLKNLQTAQNLGIGSSRLATTIETRIVVIG